MTAPARTQPLTRSARFRRVMEGLAIRDEAGRLVPMRFSQSQEQLWAHVAPRLDRREKLWYIVLKARQIYSSTFFQALTFVRTLEQPGTHTLLLAQDLDTSYNLFDMARRFYDHLRLPKLLPSRVKELDFPFPAGTSKYRVISAGTVAKGRGTTQTCVHCSETAFWPRPEILLGLFQAMPDLPDTLWVIESTANGMAGQGAMFYEEWNRAVRGESDLQPIFIPWFSMPKYQRDPVPEDDWDETERLLATVHGLTGAQIGWRRYAIATKCQGSVDRFNQEFPASPEDAFIASGQPAFNQLSLLRQRANIQPPRWRGVFVNGVPMALDKGEIRVWRWPEAGHQYVIGADTAEGFVGGDYACAQVLDMETLEQVATIHGTLAPYEFATQLNALGRHYRNATLCIEVYPQGHAVQDHLIRTFTYPALHRWRGKPDRIRPLTNRLYGWETNVWSRPLLVESGMRAINHDLVTVRDEGLLQELSKFSRMDTGKYEAEAGHDDRVFALLLALRSREENYLGPIRVAPAVSEPTLPRGVRVVEAHDEMRARRHLTTVLRARARAAAKHWMAH